MSTKEQIKAAAAKRFRTKEIDLGDGVKVQVREISTTERKALDARIDTDRAKYFKTGDDGKLLVENGSYIFRDGVTAGSFEVHRTEYWLAVTLVPDHTVEELLDPGWPESLKADLLKEAMKINGITVEDAAGNS